jgi:Peptidase family S41/N-terminal domain of Peptidase_S41 in eukaryotic IRBP
MSERIYAWLLRLYPSGFREAYSDEALQLFRDRARDEKGFLPRVRLWVDLFADLGICVLRGYSYVQPTLVGASIRQRLDGGPSFHLVASESPSLGALFFGGVLTLAALVAFPISLRQSGNHLGRAAISSDHIFGSSRFSQDQAPQQTPPDPAAGSNRSAPEGVKLDAAERQRVIDAAVANLKEHYVYPDIAQKMADGLLANEKAGDYDAITDGAAFAALLTRQLRDVSRDLHLEVVYFQTSLSNRPQGSPPQGVAQYRAAMQQQNCTFEKVEILPHNIGYLKLNSFPDPSVCESTAKTAMASLNSANAIIFDLRDNHGGYPSMVMLIASYLFDHPEYLYNPREDTTEQSWTRSPVSGNRLADKPAYVLTSTRTFSGAEHFSYNLKMLKRATLVGETTGGATDVGNFHRIDGRFGIAIREAKAINPYSEPDWAVVGVEPDVKVKAADALETAETLAEKKLQKK